MNIDIDFNFPGDPGSGPPSAGYGAAAAQPGTWATVSFGSGPFSITNLSGAPSGVTLTRSIIPPGSTIDLGATGDYARLVYDADRIDSTLTYTFEGLPAGQYAVYTYAAAPSFGTVATRITINGVAQLIAAAPTDGTFAEGFSHARHVVTHAGGPLNILAAKASINGVVNGFQFVPILPPPPSAFTLISPGNGSTGHGLTPTLAWNTSANAASYTVTVDTDAAFAPPAVFETTTTSTSVQVSSGLLTEGTQYFWRVLATNAVGSATATPFPATFTTAATPPPPPPTPFGLNIDVDFNDFGQPHAGVPSSSWAAAGGQPGSWASVGFGPGPFNLVGLNGVPSGAQIARSSASPGFTFDLGSSGNYAKLVYDADRIDGPGSYTITGLPAGSYIVYTYAAAPSFSTIATRVTINGSQQVIADAPIDNTFAEGRSHARHALFHPGGPLVIAVDKASINGAINGFQIVPVLAPAAVITSPNTCTQRTGEIIVAGTANGPGLTGWTLEYTGGDSSTWVPITSSATGVVNGTLARWDTTGFRPCAYTLRLRVTTSSTSVETMRSLIVALSGDVDLDGNVDFDDLSQLLTNFNMIGP
ncbi:MAG: hypothetical protein JNK58_01695 [Phycisphaerae bacterium]|nr:hypothetical protein [Phycisphaerae bacterium]